MRYTSRQLGRGAILILIVLCGCHRVTKPTLQELDSWSCTDNGNGGTICHCPPDTVCISDNDTMVTAPAEAGIVHAQDGVPTSTDGKCQNVPQGVKCTVIPLQDTGTRPGILILTNAHTHEQDNNLSKCPSLEPVSGALVGVGRDGCYVNVVIAPFDVPPHEWDTEEKMPEGYYVCDNGQALCTGPRKEHHRECTDKSRFLLMSEDEKWHCLALVPKP